MSRETIDPIQSITCRKVATPKQGARHRIDGYDITTGYLDEHAMMRLNRRVRSKDRPLAFGGP